MRKAIQKTILLILRLHYLLLFLLSVLLCATLRLAQFDMFFVQEERKFLFADIALHILIQRIAFLEMLLLQFNRRKCLVADAALYVSKHGLREAIIYLGTSLLDRKWSLNKALREQ